MGSFNPPSTSGVSTSLNNVNNNNNNNNNNSMGGGVGASGSARPPPSMFGPREDSRMQQMKLLNGPAAILWDIENCPVPGEVNAEDVAGNVRMALSMHPSFRGAVTMFSAYGDFNHFPRKVREGCQRTGINLIDVPNSKKDASDKAILVDMFLFALDNRPPCTILLITGDVDFAPALHKLGQRGYAVVLAIPAGFVSASLCSAGRYVWDWASVARGHGLVPAKTFQPRENVEQGFQRYPMFSDESGDESFKSFGGGPVPVPIQQGRNSYSLAVTSQSSGEWFQQGSYIPHQERTSPLVSPSQNFQWNQLGRLQVTSQNLGGVSSGLPSTSVPPAETSDADPLSPGAQSNTSFVQPGDLAGLKRQLVKLLSLHGGKMDLLKVPPEYCKMFGRPLYLAEYGSGKLAHLIDKMRDTVFIKGEGAERKVHLTKLGSRMGVRYKKQWGSACKTNGKAEDREQEVEEESKEVPKEESKGVVDEEVVVYVSKQQDLSNESDSEEQEEQGEEQASDHPEAEEDLGDEVIEIQEVTEEYTVEGRRDLLRHELQELLVSYAYHILVSDFLMLYRQRYGKEPDYAAFGADDLESLLDKVKDVAVLKQGPGDKRFLVANVGFLPHVGIRP